jgi:glycosyltransferase involved in cell wall biosynthesis
VSAAERNWLLTHAALVLCPSSADGFGFVPFEAALAGTASLSVSYGPFRELGGETPVWATAWNAVAFADAAQRLLDDPKLGDRQSAARRAVAADLTWDKTASHLVRAFRDVLSRPASSTDEPWPTAQHLAARFRRT